jgi:hypothetical protein
VATSSPVSAADIPFGPLSSVPLDPVDVLQPTVLLDGAGLYGVTVETLPGDLEFILAKVRAQADTHGLDDSAVDTLSETAIKHLSSIGWPHARRVVERHLRRRSTTRSGPSQATEIVALARDCGVELWHTPAGDAYGTLSRDGHREHHPLRRIVRDYLAREYYARHKRSASSAAFTDAGLALSGQARFDGPEYGVSVRLASRDDVLYLDLGDPAWTVVAIDADGWRPVTEAPVRHWRPASLRALPVPTPGGSLDALRSLWPAIDDDTWALLVTWLVATLAPSGPFPILIEAGEQGSGKSTLGRQLRDLIDPASPALRGVPRDDRDLMIGALTSYVVALDNLSGLQPWMSDTLCRIATGGGLATRTLFSDLDETLIEVSRPILLTGIEAPTSRGDLLDRALVATLPAMTDEQRVDEADLWRAYHTMRPALLGALLDAASCALRRRASVTLARRPRMADACRWVTAAEPALGWRDGRTLALWLGAREAATADLLAADPVAQAVLGMSLPWSGTAEALLELLSGQVTERTRTARTWPASPRGLAGILRRLAPDLRRSGIEVGEPTRTGHGRQRVWDIVRTVRTVRESADQPVTTGFDDADGRADGCGRSDNFAGATVRTIPAGSTFSGLNLVDADDADDADGLSQSLGGGYERIG